MNTRTRALVASAAVVGALLAGAPFALATPDELSCPEAIKAYGKAVKSENPALLAAQVTVAETALAAAKAGQNPQAIVAAEGVLKAAKDKLAAYEKAVGDAEAAADEACKGAPGEPGAPGAPGADGKDGEDGKDGVPTFVTERQVDVVPSTDDGVETGGL